VSENKEPSWSHAVRAALPGRARKLMRRMMRTVERYSLIEPGDRILVAISGGKDSYTLLDLLWDAKKRAPFDFDIVAVHLDQAQPGYEGASLAGWLEGLGAPYEILREDTYSVVQEKTKPGQAYCFICSRLRRGILYSAAERLGCNKLAFGHHRDDALETLLMNLCFSGRVQSMPAKYTTDDGQFQVIRPLIETGEDEIEPYAEERGFPIIPCNLCGSQEGLQREKMKALLGQLEENIPDVRHVMLQALRNVRPTHLLDNDLLAAWSARPDDVRPIGEKPRRGEGTNVPEIVGSGHLRILQ
jgi:tRNA 2-thiocytidine biosynthesis protein TtcA